MKHPLQSKMKKFQPDPITKQLKLNTYIHIDSTNPKNSI